ncbi:MAG: glycosyltransferase involved in cell wall biosynthesis, partial [Alteromonas naphthalenivorans]
MGRKTNMKMKTLLTIVIPTRNRPQYLKRLLKYFIKESFNLSIIIADSSDDNYKE